VESAVEMQRVLKARNAGLPENRRMEFRVGVHLGDVAAEGERLYGDGVNIAARLEGLAQPGGVCISGEVHSLVATKLEVGFEDLGPQTLKNIPKPVRVYRVVEAEQPQPRRVGRWLVAGGVIVAGLVVLLVSWPPPKEPKAVGEATQAVVPLTSIAVLPFDDMTPGADQKWLANGIAEELTEALSRIEQLRVIGRTSSEIAKASGADLAGIGEQLQVGAIVEGSVRRSADQLLVTAQFIRVADASHLWSGRYERKLDDVFAIQREVARNVAESIRSELGISDWSVLRGARYATPDVRAWRLLLKAQEVGHGGAWNVEGFLQGREYLRQALTIDPSYAAAHGTLGWTEFQLGQLGAASPEERAQALSRARASALSALEFDESEPLGHELLAELDSLRGDWRGARLRLEAALRTHPDHAGLRAQYAFVLAETGQLREAVSQARRAVDLDPLHGIRHFQLGLVCDVAREFDCAIDAYRAADTPYAKANLPRVLHRSGMNEEALDALVEVFESRRAAGRTDPELALRRSFDTGGWQKATGFVAREFAAASGGPCWTFSATTYAQSGNADLMFRCLEQDLLMGHQFLRNAWVWDPYRDDPRFTALLERMNLAD
jgi:TolB-like protein/thioredoxin-like negative regulator of GroEL